MIFFKSKSGFSLLEMTIAMGLAVGLLVFYMKIQSEQAKVALTTKVNQEVETFFTDFKAVISRPGFCSKSFENTTLSDNSELEILNIKNPLGDIRYAVGEFYGNKYLKLNGINLKNFKADDQDGLEGIATLELKLERIGKIYGGNKIKKSMEISVSRDQVKKIVACTSLSSAGVNVQVIQPESLAKILETNSDKAVVTIPAVPAISAAQQAELVKTIQNDPQFKQLQDALKTIQDQNQNNNVETDE